MAAIDAVFARNDVVTEPWSWLEDVRRLIKNNGGTVMPIPRFCTHEGLRHLRPMTLTLLNRR